MSKNTKKKNVTPTKQEETMATENNSTNEEISNDGENTLTDGTDDIDVTVGADDVMSETSDAEPEVAEQNMMSPEVLNDDPFKTPPTDDADILQLYKLMNDYIRNIRLGAGIGRTEENVVKFVAIGKFISRRNRMRLVEIFYTEIMSSAMSNIMAQDLVFQFMEKINDEDKGKIQTLYTSLMALRKWLESPKNKLGFPLDMKKIDDSFGGEALSGFLKKFIQQ